MIRVINFVCVALMGLTILALYHVSEQTRIARLQLNETQHSISTEQVKMSVLQAEWQQVANPERIQRLAQSSLGMNDTATVQLSSLTQLPRRGDDSAPGDAQVRSASAQMPVQPRAPIIKIAARSGM